MNALYNGTPEKAKSPESENICWSWTIGINAYVIKLPMCIFEQINLAENTVTSPSQNLACCSEQQCAHSSYIICCWYERSEYIFNRRWGRRREGNCDKLHIPTLPKICTENCERTIINLVYYNLNVDFFTRCYSSSQEAANKTGKRRILLTTKLVNKLLYTSLFCDMMV